MFCLRFEGMGQARMLSEFERSQIDVLVKVNPNWTKKDSCGHWKESTDYL